MMRKSLLWFGVLLILIGILPSLYEFFARDCSDRDLRPVDVGVNTSGRETHAEFTALRQTRYFASVVVEVPRGASDDDAMHKYACMMRQPGCHSDSDQCREPGQLQVSEIALNGTPQKDESADCHYGINGNGDQRLATRDLFFFDAVPRQRYVAASRISANTPALTKLRPRLIVEASFLESEKEDLTFLGWEMGGLLLVLLGIVSIVVSVRWKRCPRHLTTR